MVFMSSSNLSQFVFNLLNIVGYDPYTIISNNLISFNFTRVYIEIKEHIRTCKSWVERK